MALFILKVLHTCRNRDEKILNWKEDDMMFEILFTCKAEELLSETEQLFGSLKDENEAEQLIRILWRRVPELTDEQEKQLHKLGRKIRKKFHMKPVKI